MDGFSEAVDMVVCAISCMVAIVVFSLVILASSLAFLAGMHFGDR